MIGAMEGIGNRCLVNLNGVMSIALSQVRWNVSRSLVSWHLSSWSRWSLGGTKYEKYEGSEGSEGSEGKEGQ